MTTINDIDCLKEGKGSFFTYVKIALILIINTYCKITHCFTNWTIWLSLKLIQFKTKKKSPMVIKASFLEIWLFKCFLWPSTFISADNFKVVAIFKHVLMPLKVWMKLRILRWKPSLSVKKKVGVVAYKLFCVIGDSFISNMFRN